MRIVELTQWSSDDSEFLTNCQVVSFPDTETINRPVSADSDFPLALQDVAGRLYDYSKKVIATKRNQDNDAWLALCKITE